jgi:hypothetical protein
VVFAPSNPLGVARHLQLINSLVLLYQLGSARAPTGS